VTFFFFTVQVLWDKETKTIVNNESADIVRMLNTEFNQLAKKPEFDIYPEALRTKIDEANEWICKYCTVLLKLT